MQKQYLAYTRQYLLDRNADRSEAPGQRFRSHADHMARVAMWLTRLMAQGGEMDTEALHLAVAFHDVGYCRGAEDHASHSADILRTYAAEAGLDAALTEHAAFLVAEHSRKADWLPRHDAPYSLILLMEADLLDEEGAIGLVRDCLNAGEQGARGYQDAYVIMQQFEPERLIKNPMVTPLGKGLWEEKQRLIASFMRAFAYDLGIEENEPSWSQKI